MLFIILWVNDYLLLLFIFSFLDFDFKFKAPMKSFFSPLEKVLRVSLCIFALGFGFSMSFYSGGMFSSIWSSSFMSKKILIEGMSKILCFTPSLAESRGEIILVVVSVPVFSCFSQRLFYFSTLCYIVRNVVIGVSLVL